MTATRPARQSRRGRNTNLLEALLKMGDEWRAWQASAKNLVTGKTLRPELTRQGKLTWYLHPAIREYSVRNLLIFMQEIPPGSRSGKQKHPGGLCHYILEGKGYTVVDGEKHEW